MKANLHSPFAIRPSAVTAFGTALVSALALLTTASRLPAQSVWTNALSFDGTNDYVAFSRPVSNNFTIECWFRTTQTNGADWQWYAGMGMVDAEMATTTNDFGLSLGAGKLLFGTGGGGVDVTIRSRFVADGEWHHVAATRARIPPGMELYVDGELVAGSLAVPETLSAPLQMRLGSLATGINFFQGELDEVRIWSVARTIEEIRQPCAAP